MQELRHAPSLHGLLQFVWPNMDHAHSSMLVTCPPVNMVREALEPALSQDVLSALHVFTVYFALTISIYIISSHSLASTYSAFWFLA